uniref:Phosphatidylinositol transfer protein N-terminal domain-containing protein n=1 Tax=Timema shepardi TaxID=629360 RepID=A0A7R9ANT3_TIMSH|nr:unnamed protein product [Timema shepardi]
MIARHSHEQTDSGEGVEVVANETCEDPEYGTGQFTEKRIHLSRRVQSFLNILNIYFLTNFSRLPYWVQALIPKVFYVTEKAWNYYPFTITEYTCSFLPKFNISIKTKYENNNGTTENCLNLPADLLKDRIVEHVDIAYDEVNPKHYKEDEDLRFFQSAQTGRGPLIEGWRDIITPIMCSYKVVSVSFEVWGLQTKAEDMIHRTIREILLLGHRQAFAWIDEWYGMSLKDVRAYEVQMQIETNTRVTGPNESVASRDARTCESEGQGEVPMIREGTDVVSIGANSTGTTPAPTTPTTPQSPKSWFSWS